MANHNLLTDYYMARHTRLSESEEMYLVTIRKICEHCADKPIPIPDIAEGLAVQPVSVNQMVKKLAEADLVVYTPYKGVELTPKGRAISTEILRHRRLWETFLVKDLSMHLDEADALACQLEHITSQDVANRLSNFLDNPTVCFHGNPIYPAQNQTAANPSVALHNVKVGQLFQVVRLDGDENLRSFLADMGIFAGNRGRIIATNGSGNLLVETSADEHVTVTKEIAENIFVEEQYV
jgi:DtxR family transcriptional regulator, Mn-dependent transcriptional regulator